MGYLIIFLVFFLPTLLTASAYAATFEVRNDCSFTVWGAYSALAATPPIGGGRRLDQGQTWTFNVPPGTAPARIWGRTNCTFDSNGKGSCQTGDCNGALQCNGWGKAPHTIAGFALSPFMSNVDHLDISLIHGFNIPISFGPTNGPSDGECHSISCAANINSECPDVLKVPGGCNNPCTTFGTPQYCCLNIPNCYPTDYSRFFKERCHDAYSYPLDKSNTSTCPGDVTKYRVVFCPFGDVLKVDSRFPLEMYGSDEVAK